MHSRTASAVPLCIRHSLIGAAILPQQMKRYEMTDAISVASGDLLPMSVDKMGFLIDKLFDDCAPLQFVRELTKNCVESIMRLPEPDRRDSLGHRLETV